MEIETEVEFDLESEDFNLDQIVDSAVDWASSLSVPHHRIESPDITFNEATPSLELKALPKHLKYAYLGGRETLPVIIGFHLTRQQEDSLTTGRTARGHRTSTYLLQVSDRKCSIK